jgi:ATP-binding protein involved in chromosome partitioning
MSAAIKENVIKALSAVQDPARGGDIVALGMVQGLQVTVDGRVLFSLAVDPARGAGLEPLRQAAEQAVSAVSGVKEVRAILTAEKPAAGAAGAENHCRRLRQGWGRKINGRVQSCRGVGACGNESRFA